MLAVAPHWQGEGYGARLVNHLNEWLTNQLAPGCDKLLHVQADNNAVNFWSKHGFVATLAAKRLTEALAEWDPVGNQLYYSGMSCWTEIY